MDEIKILLNFKSGHTIPGYLKRPKRHAISFRYPQLFHYQAPPNLLTFA